MSIHDEFYMGLLEKVCIEHFDILADGDKALVDEGQNMPPGSYEPYMRAAALSGSLLSGNKRVLAIAFLAGPVGEAHQEYVFSMLEGGNKLVLQKKTPGEEYDLCEIIDFIFHLAIQLIAEHKGIEHTCCKCESNFPIGSIEPITPVSKKHLKAVPTSPVAYLKAVDNDKPSTNE